MLSVKHIAALALLIPLIACDGLGEYEIDPITTETVIPANGADCGCPGAADVYAKNNSQNRVRARIRKSAIVNGETISTTDLVKTISPGSRAYLGCSINKAPDESVFSNACRQRNNYKVIGHEEANLNNRLRLIRFAYSAESDFLLQDFIDETEPPAFNCKSECLDPLANNGLCVRASLNGSHSTGITNLYNALANEEISFIEKQTIMDWFDQPDDPCERSDTLISSQGLIQNSGKACIFETRLGGVDGSLVSKLFLPEEIFGQVERTSSAISVRFPNAGSRLSLELSDPALNSDFGGVVWALESDGTNMIATTENGCVIHSASLAE